MEGVPQDLTSVQWRSVEWVTAFGALTPTTVLDYFAQSPFYDPTSNNAVLRMQTQYSVEAGSGFNEAEELKRFVGTEFAVTHAEPPALFVIEKRDRKSPTEAHTIAAYYVLHNSIYQAPDLYSVVANRLLSSLFYMQSSLSAARDKKTDFTPRTGGNRYRVLDPALGQGGDGAKVEKASLAVAAAASSGEAAAVAENGVEGEDGGATKESKSKMARAGKPTSTTATGGNLDFLLARALQTASVQHQQRQHGQP